MAEEKVHPFYLQLLFCIHFKRNSTLGKKHVEFISSKKYFVMVDNDLIWVELFPQAFNVFYHKRKLCFHGNVINLNLNRLMLGINKAQQ